MPGGRTHGRAARGIAQWGMVFARSLLLALACAAAQTAPAADVSAGERLVAEKHCENCHHNKTMGDAKAVYLRSDRKVTRLEKLKAQVAACNSQLGLGLFPDKEE